MEVEECDDFGVVVFCFVAHPICKAPSFDPLKGFFARITFGTGVVFRGVAVPFKAVSTVEVDPAAEAQGGFLTVFAPEPVGFPGVNVAIWVKCGYKNPVELLEELGHRSRFAVSGNEGVGDVIDAAGADPFAGVGAAGNDDCFAGRREPFGIGGVNANAEGRDVTAFVRDADVDHADVGGEEGLKKAHPRNYDGEGLVVLEKDVRLRT